jgi:hypothetical protein
VRTSLEVADIFRAAGPAYRATHAGHLSLHQLKVMSAIEHCRTAALGGHVEACEDCATGGSPITAALWAKSVMGSQRVILYWPTCLARRFTPHYRTSLAGRSSARPVGTSRRVGAMDQGSPIVPIALVSI